ncbi:hypothetical protein ABFU38_20965 [Xanthomonas campestris pv. raphani]|uniref:hypothetical protein n=1 Tax=Xanthomonas campestris TaxID=339 RepID=UPI0038900F0D
MKIEFLKKIYEENEAVKFICDHMSGRLKNQNETTLHRIFHYVGKEGADIKRSELIAAFRLLEESECGNYVEGRHGWKSRFVWAVKSKLVAAAAQGAETGAALIAEEDIYEEIDDEGDEMIEHTYVLRHNLSITIELPADLSRSEAQRLSQFIDSLSFED